MKIPQKSSLLNTFFKFLISYLSVRIWECIKEVTFLIPFDLQTVTLATVSVWPKCEFAGQLWKAHLKNVPLPFTRIKEVLRPSRNRSPNSAVYHSSPSFELHKSHISVKKGRKICWYMQENKSGCQAAMKNHPNCVLRDDILVSYWRQRRRRMQDHHSPSQVSYCWGDLVGGWKLHCSCVGARRTHANIRTHHQII